MNKLISLLRSWLLKKASKKLVSFFENRIAKLEANIKVLQYHQQYFKERLLELSVEKRTPLETIFKLEEELKNVNVNCRIALAKYEELHDILTFVLNDYRELYVKKEA